MCNLKNNAYDDIYKLTNLGVCKKGECGHILPINQIPNKRHHHYRL